MPAKSTTQEFIDRARAIHGDKYGYAFSVYQSAHTKVFIHCPEHGVFEQTPTNHLKGQGCSGCSGNTKHSNESFIEKAKEVHGHKYDYSMVEYVNAATKVKIVCPEHGVFEQTPAAHLHGAGCPECVGLKKHTNESFIEKAKAVHGHKYDYSLVKYTGNKNKVTVFCYEHGVFEQTPAAHLSGRGCPGCMSCGFDRTKIGFLYILRSDCGQYMKIGITNKPDQRQAQLSRVTPFSFKRIELIEGPGEQIAKLEKKLLAEYQQAEFTETFDGYSEWRLWSDSVRSYLV